MAVGATAAVVAPAAFLIQARLCARRLAVPEGNTEATGALVAALLLALAELVVRVAKDLTAIAATLAAVVALLATPVMAAGVAMKTVHLQVEAAPVEAVAAEAATMVVAA